MKVPIVEIERDAVVQVRSKINPKLVEQYAELPASVFPPVVIFGNVLADGWHRVAAAEVRGESVIEAERHDGDENDALAFAISANVRHGQRLTLQEVRDAINRLRELGGTAWTAKRISLATGVPPSSVLDTLTATRMRKVASFPAAGVELSDSVLVVIATLSTEEEQAEVVSAAVEYGWKRDEVRAVVKAPPDLRKKMVLGEMEPVIVAEDGTARIMPETLARIGKKALKSSVSMAWTSALAALAHLATFPVEDVVGSLTVAEWHSDEGAVDRAVDLLLNIKKAMATTTLRSVK